MGTKLKAVTVQLPEKLARKLKMRAAANGDTLQQVMCEAVLAYLKRPDKAATA